MIIEIKIPSPGESITEVEISEWTVADGDWVEKDQEIAEIESDKATLQLIAEQSGKISLKAEAGETINVGETACTIDTSSVGEKTSKPVIKPKEEIQITEAQISDDKAPENLTKPESGEFENVKVSPLANKLMEEHNFSVNDIISGIRRINKEDVKLIAELPKEEPQKAKIAQPAVETTNSEKKRSETISRMSSLRRKLSQRLVSVKNETAMLTTFNEVDMKPVMDLRNKYKKKFAETHNVKLGFMSFFTKAVTNSLKKYPAVGSMLDGENLIVPNYCDIAIAVQAPKGLMVPIVRDAETLSLAQIEAKIAELATKARSNKLSIDEMTGGNFTITNGGVFGSLLSTPILNPPQSAILGMHNILERPIAIDGEVKIRPMMYIALSYDHRVIDGGTSVGFLVNIKKMIEDPIKLLFDADPEQLLLGL